MDRKTDISSVQYLCNGLEEDMASRRLGSNMSELDAIIAASGKMVLLFKLLPKLRAEGRKVSPVLLHASSPTTACWPLVRTS